MTGLNKYAGKRKTNCEGKDPHLLRNPLTHQHTNKHTQKRKIGTRLWKLSFTRWHEIGDLLSLFVSVSEECFRSFSTVCLVLALLCVQMTRDNTWRITKLSIRAALLFLLFLLPPPLFPSCSIGYRGNTVSFEYSRAWTALTIVHLRVWAHRALFWHLLISTERERERENLQRYLVRSCVWFFGDPVEQGIIDGNIFYRKRFIDLLLSINTKNYKDFVNRLPAWE
jgi:hypothetical protein